MTSISAASAQSYQSPLQKLQNELLSEVNSGVISSSDKDALSSALTDIDSAMQSSRASDQASGTRPSPEEMKSKIDDLIDEPGFQRQADQRSGHRIAGRLQGGVRQRPRRGRSADRVVPAAPAVRRSAAWRSAAVGWRVLERRQLLRARTFDSTTSSSSFCSRCRNQLSASSSTSYSATGSSSTSSSSASFSALLIDYRS